MDNVKTVAAPKSPRKRGLRAAPTCRPAVLWSHPAFGPVLDWSAEPEARIRFDNLKGEPRNSDLQVRATDAHGDYIIAVEAKADETFGETVGRALESAKQRLEANERSGGVKRINGLLAALVGSTLEIEPALANLRYQLLTAVAGAASVAMRDKVNRVVLLIQEFRTHLTTDAKHAQNSADLDAFVDRLSLGKVTHLSAGELAGPFTLQGAVLFNACVPVSLGKVRHELRAPLPD